MKFQWYVVDTEENTVKGENDVEVLTPYLENSRYIILSAQHGIYFNGSRNQNEVLPLNAAEEEDDEDDKDEDNDDEGEDPEDPGYDDTDDDIDEAKAD